MLDLREVYRSPVDHQHWGKRSFHHHLTSFLPPGNLPEEVNGVRHMPAVLHFTHRCRWRCDCGHCLWCVCVWVDMSSVSPAQYPLRSQAGLDTATAIQQRSRQGVDVTLSRCHCLARGLSNRSSTFTNSVWRTVKCWSRAERLWTNCEV